MAAVLAAEDLPLFAPVATTLAPVRRALGISQSWAMFAPNPARSTDWLVVEGRREGRWHRLDQAGTTPMEDAAALRYLRAGKFTRGLLPSKVRRDREHLARWWCATEPELESVRFLHARVSSGPPGTPVPTGPEKRTPIGQHPCR